MIFYFYFYNNTQIKHLSVHMAKMASRCKLCSPIVSHSFIITEYFTPPFICADKERRNRGIYYVF